MAINKMPLDLDIPPFRMEMGPTDSDWRLRTVRTVRTPLHDKFGRRVRCSHARARSLLLRRCGNTSEDATRISQQWVDVTRFSRAILFKSQPISQPHLLTKVSDSTHASELKARLAPGLSALAPCEHSTLKPCSGS